MFLLQYELKPIASEGGVDVTLSLLQCDVHFRRERIERHNALLPPVYALLARHSAGQQFLEMTKHGIIHSCRVDPMCRRSHYRLEIL